MTIPIGADGTASSAYDGPSTNRVGGNEIDKDMFLELMVTQLKYQDPLNPSDSTEMLSQTAQFTAVEQLTELAHQGEATALHQRMATASGLVGRTVTYLGDDGQRIDEAVRSAALTDDGGVSLTLAGGSTIDSASIRGIVADPAT